MKALTLKPSGSLASVMLTGYRVIVNEFCTSLNRKMIEPCWSPSLSTESVSRKLMFSTVSWIVGTQVSLKCAYSAHLYVCTRCVIT